MKAINGFHTIWSKPYLISNNTNEYFMQDYELLTMILSALMWRKKNGDIFMYGDKPALEYLKKLHIDHIWNGGLYEIDVPDRVSEKVFWAAGKMYALNMVPGPTVMVDLDLIVWKDVTPYIEGTEICAIHREGIFPDIYPGKDFFNMSADYKFDDEWNWDAFPVNTCMLYLSDQKFKDYYTGCSIEFMEHSIEANDNLCHMVFAEQRLLAMCADKMGKVVCSFFPGSMDIENQDLFTHLWGYKNVLKFNYEQRIAYNNKLWDRIIQEFPEEEKTLAGLPIARQ